MALNEKTEVRVTAGVVVGTTLLLAVWIHGRITAVEVEAVKVGVQRDQLQKESDQTTQAIVEINEKLGDLKGDMREVRVMLEQKLTRNPRFDPSAIP